MPPTVKENENLSCKAGYDQRPAPTSALPSDTAIKQQPVALEVPVTVNGARTVEGSDKREPFSETTKTVLVIGKRRRHSSFFFRCSGAIAFSHQRKNQERSCLPGRQVPRTTAA